MRNPYFVEIKTENGIFAEKKNNKNDTSVLIKEFNL
jgi:hypothetical protein